MTSGTRDGRTSSSTDVLRLIGGVLFVGVYFLAAQVGFLAAFVAEQVSPVWPPSGLALWATLRFGSQLWPAIWLGAFFANLSAGGPILPATAIATGNTLETLVGVWILRRLVDIDYRLESLRQVTSLLIAAGISTTIGATIGVTALSLAGVESWTRFTQLWWIWWLGDATSDILVAPLLLVVPLWRRYRWSLARAGEMLALLTVTVLTSVVIFVVPSVPLTATQSLEFVTFPLVMWAGLRFAHPGAALVAATSTVMALWGTLDGQLALAANTAALHDHIIVLQIYLAVMASSGLVLGAAIADRNRSDTLRDLDHRLTAILAEEADLQSATPRILQAVCERLDWELAVLWLADNDQQLLTYVDSWPHKKSVEPFVDESRARLFRPGVGLPGRVWSTAKPAWIHDVLSDPNFPRAKAAEKTGLHAGFAFPILLGTEVFGVVEFFSRKPRSVDPALLALMGAAGSQVGQFIDRRRAQQRVGEGEALNSAVVNAVLDCVISIDADGRVLEFNPAATQTFGIPRHEALGRDLADLIIPARFRDQHREGLRRAIETNQGQMLGQRVEMAALRAGGTEIPVELSITRVAGTRHVVFTACLRDISERKRLDVERANLLAREQDARRQAESANRAKDQFLSTVSHELRTPLTAILGWAAMLRSGEYEPSRLQYIHEGIYRNAEVQARIVNDLLDVSRIVRGQLRMELQPVDLAEVMRSSVETIRPAAMAKRLALTCRIPESPLYVSGDPDRLQQVCWNLLSNATKFTGAGGSITVDVHDSNDGHVALVVTDSGIGIPDDFLPHVFERFWQGDGTSTRAHGGLGLGLAIVRHIVELHGGEVSVQSSGHGLGSTFTVRLPALLDASVEQKTHKAGASGATL